MRSHVERICSHLGPTQSGISTSILKFTRQKRDTDSAMRHNQLVEKSAGGRDRSRGRGQISRGESSKGLRQEETPSEITT